RALAAVRRGARDARPQLSARAAAGGRRHRRRTHVHCARRRSRRGRCAGARRESLTVSFILDALRKSESERQRSQVPGIAHVPLAVARPTLPVWAIAVMAVLGASAVAMAGAWWLALDA